MGKGGSSRTPQEAECNITSMDVFHISEDMKIEVLGEVHATPNAEGINELEGSEVIFPLAQ